MQPKGQICPMAMSSVARFTPKTHLLGSFRVSCYLASVIFRDSNFRAQKCRSLTTSRTCRQNHGFIIRHFKIADQPTKKAHFLPNRFRKRWDKWYRPIGSNQGLKLNDHPRQLA